MVFTRCTTSLLAKFRADHVLVSENLLVLTRCTSMLVVRFLASTSTWAEGRVCVVANWGQKLLKSLQKRSFGAADTAIDQYFTTTEILFQTCNIAYTPYIATYQIPTTTYSQHYLYHNTTTTASIPLAQQCLRHGTATTRTTPLPRHRTTTRP